MKKKILTYCLFAVSIYSCGTKEKFEDNYFYLKNTPRKIEFYSSLNGTAFRVSNNPAFVIVDQIELENVMDEIRTANNPTPWKGARWNQLKLYFEDTIVSINTNNKVIGFSSSGQFYELREDNFIKKHSIK